MSQVYTMNFSYGFMHNNHAFSPSLRSTAFFPLHCSHSCWYCGGLVDSHHCCCGGGHHSCACVSDVHTVIQANVSACQMRGGGDLLLWVSVQCLHGVMCFITCSCEISWGGGIDTVVQIPWVVFCWGIGFFCGDSVISCLCIFYWQEYWCNEDILCQ